MVTNGWGWVSAILVIAVGIFCGLTFWRSCGGHTARAAEMPAMAQDNARCYHDANRAAPACLP